MLFHLSPLAYWLCADHNASGAELLVQVDDTGAITRCETRNANDPVVGCACDAVQATGRGVEAFHGTRAFVGISFRPADRVSPARAVISPSVRAVMEPYEIDTGGQRWRQVVSDASIDGWDAPPPVELADCFVQHQGLDTLELAGRVHFGPTGETTEVRVVSGAEGLTGAELGCVVEVMSGSQAPCPAQEATVAEFTASVSFRVIGSVPQSSGLEGVLSE